MKKGNQTSKPEITLFEKVDTETLELLLSSSGINEETRQQLKMYYLKRQNKSIPINYYFSKNSCRKGRLYAQNGLSLQGFKKEIRHALAKDIYYDIDMENAHPTLIMQYCKKHDIPCTELEKYVNNRTEILEKIKKYHNINRDQAKKLMLRLCYLGNYVLEEIDKDTEEITEYFPNKKMDFVVGFQDELKRIAKSICNIEDEIYNHVKQDNDKPNKKSSTLSIVAQNIEHKCLMSMYEYFTNRGFTVGVFCFDGMMVEINDQLTKKMDITLEDCARYVFKKTSYKIKLDHKPMDMQLSIILPKYSNFVCSDLDAQVKLFKIEGKKKFQYCKGNLYVFNEKTGMFDTNIETLFHYFIKNKEYFNIHIDEKKQSNYGESATLMRNTLPFVKTAALNDDWLSKTENTSLGYLLFKDGIYNMRTGEFERGFDPSIVFHARVPWNFPKRRSKEVEAAMDISFNRLFQNPKPIIMALARALAGDFKIKKYYFCPGQPNAGKSYIIKMLEIAFGGYIGNFNAESLAYTSSNDTKDEAAKMRWSLLVRYCRILLSNEVNMKKKLDGNAIKKHSSGGDRLIARTHNKEEVCFTPHYTIFCMLNDIPEIEPMDAGVMRRLEYIEFPFVFVDKQDVNKKKFYKEKDPNLDLIITKQSFINGFIHIFLDAYKEFLEEGMPEFDQEVKNNWTTESQQQNRIIELINEYFDITNDMSDTVSVADLRKFRNNNKSTFHTISVKRFNEILEKDLGLVSDRTTSIRFWFGIKKKN